MATDAEVIAAVLRGDTERYAELVTRYQQAAWKLAYSFVRNWEDAKDISQNGFVNAYQRLRNFRRDAKFSTWLYRIIVNECKDLFKHRARRIRVVDPVASDDDGPMVFDVADPTGDPSDVLASRELATRLQQAIASLAEQQRAAFVLHHLNGLSIEEIAEVMNCRVGTVKSHLFRACARLREQLASYLHEHAEVPHER